MSFEFRAGLPRLLVTGEELQVMSQITGKPFPVTPPRGGLPRLGFNKQEQVFAVQAAKELLASEPLLDQYAQQARRWNGDKEAIKKQLNEIVSQWESLLSES